MMRKPKKSKTTSVSATWPMKSDSVGVNPDQVKSAREHAQKIGVPTDFCPETGCAIFTSAKHRKQYCEKTGYYTMGGKGAGLSDPVRLTPKEQIERGLFDANRLPFIGNQQKFSENWTKVKWSKKP